MSDRPGSAPDLPRALRTARALVARICECGHLKHEHDRVDYQPVCHGPTPRGSLRCQCLRFTPAPLTVSEAADR